MAYAFIRVPPGGAGDPGIRIDDLGGTDTNVQLFKIGHGPVGTYTEATYQTPIPIVPLSNNPSVAQKVETFLRDSDGLPGWNFDFSTTSAVLEHTFANNSIVEHIIVNARHAGPFDADTIDGTAASIPGAGPILTIGALRGFPGFEFTNWGECIQGPTHNLAVLETPTRTWIRLWTVVPFHVLAADTLVFTPNDVDYSGMELSTAQVLFREV